MSIINGEKIAEIRLDNHDWEAIGEIKYFWAMIERACGYNSSRDKLAKIVADIKEYASDYAMSEARTLFKVSRIIETHAKKIYGETSSSLTNYINSLFARVPDKNDVKYVNDYFAFEQKIYDSLSDYSKQYLALSEPQYNMYKKDKKTVLTNFLVFIKYFQQSFLYDYEHLYDLTNHYGYGKELVQMISKLLQYVIDDRQGRWLQY